MDRHGANSGFEYGHDPTWVCGDGLVRQLAEACLCVGAPQADAAKLDACVNALCAIGSAQNEALARLCLEIRPQGFFFRGTLLAQDVRAAGVLAFKLFRDGVDALIFEEGSGAETLLGLAELCAARFNDGTVGVLDANALLHSRPIPGIRLLWRQGADLGSGRPLAATVCATNPNWDLPLTTGQTRRLPAFEPVPVQALADLRAELDDSGRAHLQLAHEILGITAAGDSLAVESASALLEALCRYLLSIPAPHELAKVIAFARHSLPGGGPQLDLAYALSELLDTNEELDGNAFVELCSLATDGELEALVDRFLQQQDSAARATLKQLLLKLAAKRPEPLVKRLGTCDAESAAELFTMVTLVAPRDRAIEAAYGLCEHPSMDLQLGILEVIAGDKNHMRLAEAARQLLASEHQAVRLRAVAIYGEHAGESGLEVLRQIAERLARSGKLERAEARQFGRALIKAAPNNAPDILRGWLTPGGFSGLLRRLRQSKTTRSALQWAALYGLADDPSDAAIGALAAFDKSAEGDQKELCTQTLKHLRQRKRDQDQSARWELDRTGPMPIHNPLERSGKWRGTARKDQDES